MENMSKIGRRALQKALKERLERLTHSLGQAEIGGKGIELIKEMKELSTLLEAATLKEEKTENPKQTPQETVHIVYSWGE